MEKTAIMEKLYYEDPYQKTFTAQVLSCEPGKKGRYQVIIRKAVVSRMTLVC